ncbi:hypothetical protein REPUB_Repub08aG0206900 [Reevesia pubescens]
MEVQILSRETIKPSSPTPHHQRTYKLSLIDQLLLVSRAYIPIIFFYSTDPSNQNLKNRSHQLKDSLSKTLTYFYPFTGRLKDGFTIDCNDEGATYIETEVASDISIVLQEADVDLLLQLLPCDPYENLPEPTAQVMLAIQVNYFACGGLAIGVCISHVLADASAAATFLSSWAAVASGSNPIIDNVIYDFTTLFTPQDFSSCSKFVYECLRIPVPEGKVVTKRFLFDGIKLTSLRNEIGNASRYEAISALIWFAMLKITMKLISQAWRRWDKSKQPQVWEDVPSITGAFIVNIGDMLERWTNCLFLSTIHRVMPTGEERYSVSFFINPNKDCIVECLESCCSESCPPRFPPIRSLRLPGRAPSTYVWLVGQGDDMVPIHKGLTFGVVAYLLHSLAHDQDLTRIISSKTASRSNGQCLPCLGKLGKNVVNLETRKAELKKDG